MRKETNMLVLSRKKNESIVINNDITIVVVEIRGDKVRLGIEAPIEVPVHRREVYEAILRGNPSPSISPSPPAPLTVNDVKMRIMSCQGEINRQNSKIALEKIEIANLWHVLRQLEGKDPPE